MSEKDSTQRWYEGQGRENWFTERRRAHADHRVATATVTEAAREVPVHAEAEVLVVGGGPAGCAAATAAARLGAEVLLVERYGHLGGLATGGLVFWIDRMTDWEGNHVIRGYAADVLERLPLDAVHGPDPDLWGSHEESAVAYWQPRLNAFRETVTWSPMVDPEWLKIVSMQLLDDAGGQLLLHSWAVQTIVENGAVRGVIFESKQGRRAILAKVVVDASGDLDVCALAGAAYESDIDTGDVNHCMNVVWCFGGVDMDRWLEFARKSQDEWRALMKQATDELGYAEVPVRAWRNDVCVFMGPRLSGYSGLDVDDLTAVELESRRRMAAHLRFFREHAPGFEHAWIMTTAQQPGIRHTRRLVGVRKLSADDWKGDVVHDDEIGVSPSPGPKFAPVSVPYGALVPVELDNVLAPGRHLASDPSTQSFMREIPQCWLTGHAAGVAAALSAATGRRPRDVEIAKLQTELQAQGAYLRARSRATIA